MKITQEILDQRNDNSLYNTMGIRIEEAEGGIARARMEVDPRLCWPFPGQPHGGILFTFMDSTMAWAVFSDLEPGLNCATINLDIQYTYPARGDLFRCSARVTHRTGRISFVRAEIMDREDRLLAMGQGTFRAIRVKERFTV